MCNGVFEAVKRREEQIRKGMRQGLRTKVVAKWALRVCMCGWPGLTVCATGFMVLKHQQWGKHGTLSAGTGEAKGCNRQGNGASDWVEKRVHNC